VDMGSKRSRHPLKTILCLDQNYVSHLTKARLGVKVNPPAGLACEAL
jgi:hypothetical protein